MDPTQVQSTLLHSGFWSNKASGALGGPGRRVVAACVLVVWLAAAACSRPSPAADRAPVDAAGLFAQACAKCHGADGAGGLATVVNGPRPSDLTAGEWQNSRSDQEVAAAIRDGRGAMPPFADVLTSEQIEALGSYIRTLKRQR
jgi:mono/diheme cytochrome c family protein